MKSMNTLQSNSLILAKIMSGFIATMPSYDIDLRNQCISGFEYFKKNFFKTNHAQFSRELNISAASHMEYIKYQMGMKTFLTEQQMDAFQNSHIQFLKDEFLDIIRLIDENSIYSIYEENYDILEDRINNSKDLLYSFLEPFRDQVYRKKTIQTMDIKEQIQKGSNYTMKERENIREVKVIIQINKNLKSEIEQDF